MAPLQVLTLNTWGLWLVSKKRYNRILHLAEFLANDTDQKHKLDVVLLQEVWVDWDVRILATAAEQGGLTHCMHFRSGVFGSGLLTLSRYPIVEAAFHQYHCAGDPVSVTCGDYLAAKGVGWTRLDLPSGYLDVFNTHLHANYSHKYRGSTNTQDGCRTYAAAAHLDIPAPAVDEFAAFRMAQVFELARFVRHVSNGAGSGALGVVLAGDLNSGPETLEHAMLRNLLPQLRDAWLETHGSQGEAWGHTCNAECSSFKPRRQRPSRIDYVMTTSRVAGCELVLQKTREGHSFSDHIAVQAWLELPSAAVAAEPSEQQQQKKKKGKGEGEGEGKKGQEAAAEKRVALLVAARSVLQEGVRQAGQASAGHVHFAIIMAVQAVLLCFFEPTMSFRGFTLNPNARHLLSAAVLVLAAGAGMFLLTGMVADAGQVRALQQALQQLQVLIASATGGSSSGNGDGDGDGDGTAAAAGMATREGSSQRSHQEVHRRR
ncbi:hypothetical protein VaNZ11_008512 [Volvox africanus]|uniref:Endonuclease/exonuclease/phosphatase domain-containing protein n=1 Tax=Volvox africanus TaxID=51714 RepID=A0ABQ5S6M3_9CHLO|nr:hypothetical protein VaNZ11_008512 [Volvox africanus]